MRKPSSNKMEVYYIIKDKIMFLEMKPGSAINEEALAKELGVSRTPVREALILLSNEKFINVFPQKGTFVSLLDLSALKEYTYLRRIFEENILMELTDKNTEVNSKVEDCLALQEIAAKNNNYKEFLKHCEEFHRRLTYLSGHGALWDSMKECCSHLNRYNALNYFNSSHMGDSFKEHKMIVDYIEGKDKEKLLALLKKHHYHRLKNSEELLEKYSAYFLIDET